MKTKYQSNQQIRDNFMDTSVQCHRIIENIGLYGENTPYRNPIILEKALKVQQLLHTAARISGEILDELKVK